MGLGYTPLFKVRGAHAKLINSRLLSWELIDASGKRSDQLSIRCDTRGIEGLPKEGETIGIEVGYQQDKALTDLGEYKITRVTPRIYPDSVAIVATAAPFIVKDITEFKKRRSKSVGNTTLGTLFREIVNYHGYSPRIAPELDGIKIAHIDQTDETDMSFLTRIARQYDAVTKPIDGLYVLARRGQVKTISGQDLKPVHFRLPAENKPVASSFINASVDFPSRNHFAGVVAVYWDSEAAKEIEIKLGEPPFKKIRYQHESAQQAHEVASNALRKLTRHGVKLKMEVPGNPLLVAEGLIALDSSFPEYMRGRWSLDKVISKGSRGLGYRCLLDASPI